ncbi:MAG TPA: ATP-dependent DNA ligase [Gemmatimonadaceae bacterium]|nr:ATP-dependent DNA ligase [Gemmatimonadaceae bacterium]
MRLPIPLSYAPMEARVVAELPRGPQWQYEPKWDGFRCLAFRDGDHVELRSKSGQPLTRYFPEVVRTLLTLPAKRFVLDGELVVPTERGLSFDALLLRLHPAESRVLKLARETPAIYLVFDLLVDARGRDRTRQPLSERRATLEAFAEDQFAAGTLIILSPASRRLTDAREWLAGRAGTDGVMAKRLDLGYAAGERTAMEKIKRKRTADCVVGGFRYGTKERIVGSLLLGLYDEAGTLHHVGFTSSLPRRERERITPLLEKLAGGSGFTGRAPGGPSRWSTERSGEWESLEPKLVVEIEYDHFTNGRFRHGTKFLRWRPEKSPAQCRLSQVAEARAEADANLGGSEGAQQTRPARLRAGQAVSPGRKVQPITKARRNGTRRPARRSQ